MIASLSLIFASLRAGQILTTGVGTSVYLLRRALGSRLEVALANQRPARTRLAVGLVPISIVPSSVQFLDESLDTEKFNGQALNALTTHVEAWKSAQYPMVDKMISMNSRQRLTAFRSIMKVAQRRTIEPESEIQRPKERSVIAERFMTFRETNYFSQIRLARLIGVSRQSICEIENCQVLLHQTTWERFLKFENRYAQAAKIQPNDDWDDLLNESSRVPLSLSSAGEAQTAISSRATRLSKDRS